MEKFSIKDRIKSFGFAFEGIAALIKTEHNFWIHLVAILVTTSAGFFFSLAPWEWVSVVFCFGVVLLAEAFNSSIEVLSNRVSTEINPLIKQTKDMAAGAVLIATIMAVIIGCIIFIPKIINLF